MSQALIIHLKLSDEDLGTDEDDDAVQALEDNLERAISAAAAGELDGHEFGGGECVIFLYGPSADLLFDIIEPHLKAAVIADGGFAIKRYGDARTRGVREVRVGWYLGSGALH